ncbi:MAG: nucleotidyltransferase family protein [Sedimentisphaerales bacterium]|jgi:predicted nucleotidyltransferase
MLTKEEVIAILRRELPYLAREYGVRRVGLFGSYAKGTQKEDSDVDVVVEFDRPIGLKFIKLWEYLERQLGTKADVLTRAGIKGIRLRNVAESIRDSILYV